MNILREKEAPNNTINLSILIPTYNRAHYLKEALDSVISQLDEIGEEIEIIISDHGCVDETPQLVEEYKKNFPALITYYRNVEEIDSYLKVDAAIRKAKGEYVWILCDDDMLEKGAIKKVLWVIKNYKNISWIFVNYIRYDPDMKRKRSMVVKIPKDYCCKGEEFFRITRFANTTYSSNIIKKKEWENYSFGKYLNISALHPQTIVPIYMLKNKYAYIVGHPFVRFRNPSEGKPQWLKGEDYYLVIEIEMLNSFVINLKRNNYSRSLIKMLIRGLGKGILRNIIEFRIKKITISKKAVVLIHRLYRINILLYLLSIIVLHIPVQVIIIFYKIYKTKPINTILKRYKRYFWETELSVEEK